MRAVDEAAKTSPPESTATSSAPAMVTKGFWALGSSPVMDGTPPVRYWAQRPAGCPGTGCTRAATPPPRAI